MRTGICWTKLLSECHFRVWVRVFSCPGVLAFALGAPSSLPWWMVIEPGGCVSLVGIGGFNEDGPIHSCLNAWFPGGGIVWEIRMCVTGSRLLAPSAHPHPNLHPCAHTHSQVFHSDVAATCPICPGCLFLPEGFVSGQGLCLAFMCVQVCTEGLQAS